MVPQNSEFTRKLRAAVRAKIEEFGVDVDDELPDYVMIMVGNKKDKMRMKTDLKLFLGDKTPDFVEWLFGFFQKVKNATVTTSTTTTQQQQKQSDSEVSTDKDKKRTTAERTEGKGNGGGKAVDKVTTIVEKPTKNETQRRTKESAKSTENASGNGGSSSAHSHASLSREREEKRPRPSQSKMRQLPSTHHRATFRPSKSRSPSRSRSPQRNGRGGATKQRTPLPRRTRPSSIPKRRGEHSTSPDRKSVVLASKSQPALRSVVSVPVQFQPTAHPRVRAIARSPSPQQPPPSSAHLSPPVCSSPKVMLSGGVVPVETDTQRTTTNITKIINQLDIAVAATAKDGRRKTKEEPQSMEETAEFVPRKQQIIRTIHALSPTAKTTLSSDANDGQLNTESVIDAAAATKLPRRRVIFGGGSLIFQRAIQQQQQITTAGASVTSPPKESKVTVVVRPQLRLVTAPSSVTTSIVDNVENDGATAVELAPTAKRPTQRRVLPAAKQQTGAVSLFQRAIKDTKRQRTETEDGEETGRRLKRMSSEMVEPNIAYSGGAEGVEGRKRARIETEQQHKQAEEVEEGEEEEKREERDENGTTKMELAKREQKKKQQTQPEKQLEEAEQDEEEEEEEVLTVDTSRTTELKREIKRVPRLGLALVKEHIGGVQVPKNGRTTETEKRHDEQAHAQSIIAKRRKDETTEAVERTVQPKKEEAEDTVQNVGTAMPERSTVHLKRNWMKPSNASALTTAAPMWDGRIEIDDMSSTDDEAEIDAVLEDAQRLRKIALERELPPTASMSRPLLYNQVDFSISTESGLISPSDAALLPAVTYKQLVMLSGGIYPPQSEQQQQLNKIGAGGNSAVASSAHVSTTGAACASSSATAPGGAQQQPQQRPHATVAPTTTIQAAPATMIVHQQYHYQKQQLQQQFSHPYSHGYVPPSHGSTYRYQLNRGSMSKVYTGTNKSQFALCLAMGDNESKQRLHLLREQHKQKSLSLQRHLEEQRQLLGQLQKMATTAELEQRKELLCNARKMDAPIRQLKRELDEVCEQIAKTTKCDGGGKANNGMA